MTCKNLSPLLPSSLSSSSPMAAFTDDDVPIPSSIVNPNAKFEFFSNDDDDDGEIHDVYYDDYEEEEDEEGEYKRKLLPEGGRGNKGKSSRGSSLASLDTGGSGFKHPTFPSVPSGARVMDSPFRTHG